MAVYVGFAHPGVFTAPLSAVFNPAYGDTRAGQPTGGTLHWSDGGVVPQPGVGVRLQQLLGDITATVQLGADVLPGVLHQVKTSSGIAYFGIYSGSIWIGVPFNLLYAFRAADKRTLVGRVLDDDTGQPIPNVKLHFKATDVVQLFDATQADANGGYIVFLTNGATYTTAGFNELLCTVYELVGFDEQPDHTDIFLRVPTQCRLPPVITLAGEPLEDVLNKEVGFHDYEPVKTAAVVRASDVYRLETVPGGVAVAIGAEETVLDATLTNAIALDSLPIGADGDCEFRFQINDLEVVPRRQLSTGADRADDMLPNGGLFASTGQRLRVFCRNLTAGTNAAAITARATIIGRNF